MGIGIGIKERALGSCVGRLVRSVWAYWKSAGNGEGVYTNTYVHGTFEYKYIINRVTVG